MMMVMVVMVVVMMIVMVMVRKLQKYPLLTSALSTHKGVQDNNSAKKCFFFIKLIFCLQIRWLQ
jgi:hypothetical protein